jgi:hypothetical protein
MVALEEPAKFRMISKMDGYMANSLQPSQGQLISSWKTNPSNTMTNAVETLVQTLGSAYAKFQTLTTFLVSGDYSAATDWLHLDVSQASLEGVLPYLADAEIARLSFEPANIIFPTYDSDGKRVSLNTTLPNGKTFKFAENHISKQTNGQLMGHPLSFALLCIINKAVLARSVKEWKTAALNKLYTQKRLVKQTLRVELRDIYNLLRKQNARHVAEYMLEFNPRVKAIEALIGTIRGFATEVMKTVIVNGDDILFMSTPGLYTIWKKNVADVGFVLSPGKNYCSDTMCQINSQNFEINRKTGSVERFGYLNQKLVYGQNGNSNIDAALLWDPLTHSSRVMTPDTIGRSLNEMFKLDPTAKGILPAVFQRWAGDWERTRAHRPNWFIPVCLGGYGIDPQYSLKRPSFSREQRQWAKWFSLNPDQQLYRVLGTSATQTVSALVKDKMAKYRLLPQETQGVPYTGVPSDEIMDSWMALALSADRARNINKPVLPKRVSRNKDVLAPKSGGYKPMSLEDIERWRNGVVMTSALPPVPPMTLKPVLSVPWRDMAHLRRDGLQPLH